MAITTKTQASVKLIGDPRNVSEGELNAACRAMNPKFENMSERKREKVQFEALDWLGAWGKVLGDE